MIAATNVLVIFWNFWCRIHYWCTAFWFSLNFVQFHFCQTLM